MLRRPVRNGQWTPFITAMMDAAELLAQFRRADGEH
jgi:hypothetical protein